MTEENKVGPGHPPVEHRFQPGVSGNPAGKPKGTRHLSTVIQELMDDENFELKLKDGKILKGRPSRKLAEVMYSLGISGNVKAADWLAKHGYGTKQIHEFETNPIDGILDKYGLKPDATTPTPPTQPTDVPPPEGDKPKNINQETNEHVGEATPVKGGSS